MSNAMMHAHNGREHIVGKPDPWKWSCWYHMGAGGKEGLIPRVPDTITYTKMYDGLSEGVA